MIIKPVSMFLHTASTILFIFQGAKTWALYSIRDDHNWQSFQGLRSLPILMPVSLFPQPASTILANQPTRHELNPAWPPHIHHCNAINTVWPLVHTYSQLRCIVNTWTPLDHRIFTIVITIADITMMTSSSDQWPPHIHYCNSMSTQLPTSPQVSSS